MVRFRLGTRGSPLALTQAHMVRTALASAQGWSEDAVQIVPIKTTGDRVQDRALAEIGGKALWTKELDRALYDGEIDASVHSMKDVETIRPDWLHIAAMLPRADVRDRLIGAATIAELRPGAVIGTSSPRRRAGGRADGGADRHAGCRVGRRRSPGAGIWAAAPSGGAGSGGDGGDDPHRL